MLIQVVLRILFLMVIGLRFHFLAGCQLGVPLTPRRLSLVLAYEALYFKASHGASDLLRLGVSFCFSSATAFLLQRRRTHTHTKDTSSAAAKILRLYLHMVKIYIYWE